MVTFVVPAKFIPAVEAGKLIRFGAILKDVETGKIVGHLKEVGPLSHHLTEIAMPPSISFPFDPINIISSIGQHYQLANIQHTLNSLQLTASVGALASIATFGVCVAGFAVIGDRLKKLDFKLDSAIEEIQALKKIVNHLNIKQDALTRASLQSAVEQLQIAEEAATQQRRNTLLGQAVNNFQTLKCYYFELFKHFNMWLEGELPVDAAVEMYSRITACCLGQLYAEFLLGDLKAFRATWKIVNRQASQISQLDKVKALRARTDAMLSSGENFISRMTFDRNELVKQIQHAESIALETYSRVNTMIFEAHYLEEHNLKPFAYLQECRELPPDIFLLPINSSDT